METILFALAIILLAIAGMAIGVIAGRPPIKGSCGGLACAKGISCGVCKARRGASQDPSP
ncbi:hypothetical protein AADZ90_016995 [Aestuariibius sp. 2305UL40-4]|uniref:hypothetical protein n=1 Tax=Aestuariibius violaceus TaxID=3234132 RepID=UPI00345EA03E